MKLVGIRWPEELIARIDQARGRSSRSAFVRSAVEQVLGGVAESGRKHPSANGKSVRTAGSNPVPTAGEVAERSKASVSKTEEGDTSGGSNPSLSAVCSCSHRFFEHRDGNCVRCACRRFRLK